MQRAFFVLIGYFIFKTAKILLFFINKFKVSSNEEDNTIIKFVRCYRNGEKRLKRLQRKVSKKEKGSKNRDKARQILGKLHEKISNRHMDFCFKTALYFARKYDVVVIEDINLQNMSRTINLGKSVSDLCFGKFRQMLEQKSAEYDCSVIKADRWFASSKICSVCGEKNTQLKLSDREWVCPHCETFHNRDLNAAVNLERYFSSKLNTAGTAGI